MATPRGHLKDCRDAKHLNNTIKRLPTDSPSSPIRRRKISVDHEEDDNESDFDETDCTCLTFESERNIGLYTDVGRTSCKAHSHKLKKRSPVSIKYNDGSNPKESSAPTKSPNSSKVYPDLSEFRQRERRTGSGRFVLIGFVLVLIISIYLVGRFLIQTPAMILNYHPPPKDLEKIHAEIKSSLKILSVEMKQTRHFWTTVSSMVTDVVEDSPPQPSIMLALVPLDSQKTAACLLQRLTEDISSAFEDTKVLIYDGKSASHQSPTVVSHELEDFFAELNVHHTAVVHNLEGLPPKSAMILHAFCDNENAPHKRSLIILTLGVDLHYDNLSLDGSNADRLLQNLWQNSLRVVDSAAIISRIANAPVIIKPEDHSIIDEMCPYK